MTALQELIVRRMTSRGWTRADLEARGAQRGTLGMYVNGKRLAEPPRQDTLRSLAKALDLPLPEVQKAALATVDGYEVFSYDIASPGVRGLIADLEPLSEAQLRKVRRQLQTILTDLGVHDGD
jgi:transcriptional regulator with XRE-family HTH domain